MPRLALSGLLIILVLVVGFSITVLVTLFIADMNRRKEEDALAREPTGDRPRDSPSTAS